MGATCKAFVSSTYEDLKAHRAFVIDALRGAGIFVDPMEDWTAEPDEPKRFSVDRLDGCNLCVLLVALRRGFVPPGGTKSITQLEYQGALDRGIDVLTFLLDEEQPWPRRFDALDDDLRQWRGELATRHGLSRFGLEPRSIPIERALTRWVTKQNSKVSQVGFDWVQLVSNLLGLKKHEPGTWTLAAQLLPHALAAVEREYLKMQHLRDDGQPPAASAAVAPASLAAAPIAASQPIRTVLANSPQFFDESRAKYEHACFTIMPFGRKRVGDVDVDFEEIYQQLLKPSIEAVHLPDGSGLSAVRVDMIFSPATSRPRYSSIWSTHVS